MPRDEVQLSNAPPLPPHCFEISVAQQVFMCVCVWFTSREHYGLNNNVVQA